MADRDLTASALGASTPSAGTPSAGTPSAGTLDAGPPYAGTLCCALPGLIAAALTVVMLALAAAGRHPAWPHASLTLSEAAALRDLGEVARLLSAGADPNAASAVRPGVLDSEPGRVTPLAAAVEARRAEIVSFLLARGAAPSPAEWQRLSCAARSRGAADVERELSRWRKGAVATCDPQ